METVRLIAGIPVLLLALGIVPVLTGAAFSFKLKTEYRKGLTFNYTVGILVMLAVMQLYSVPFTLLQCSFTSLVILYSGTLALFCVFSLLRRRRYLAKLFQNAGSLIKRADKKWFLLVALIYLPVIALSFFTPYIYGDDKTYLTMVNDIAASDTLYMIDTATGEPITWVSAKYALSSYWTFLAWLVKITGIHTLILCKTILAFFIAPISYAVQGLLFSFLFRSNERKMLAAMFFLNLLQLFGCFSIYSVSYRLYTWIWQSKAFLAIIVIPFLFYYCNLIFEKKCAPREYLCLSVFITAACSTTLTGAGLAVLMVMLLSVIYAFLCKRPLIVIGAGLAGIPAAVYMLLYLRYDMFVSWLRVQGVFRGIS